MKLCATTIYMKKIKMKQNINSHLGYNTEHNIKNRKEKAMKYHQKQLTNGEALSG